MLRLMSIAAVACETQNALTLWHASRLRGAVGRSVVSTTAVIARPVVLFCLKRCYLLDPRIRCFTTINYLCLVLGRSYEQINKVRTQPETIRSRQLLSESGFVLCLAPPLLSRERRINMRKERSIALTSGKYSASVDDYRNCTLSSCILMLYYMCGNFLVE